MFGWEDLRSWGSFVMAIGAVAYTALTGRSKSNAADIVSIREDLKKHDRRIQKVEDTLEHMPTKDQLHELSIGLTALHGAVNTLSERVDNIGRIVSDIDQSLRQEPTK